MHTDSPPAGGSARIVRKWPVLIVAAALLVTLEINQQAHADLLGSRPDTTALSGLVVYAVPRVAAAAGAAWLLRARGRRVP
jgi:hypothetical protein